MTNTDTMVLIGAGAFVGFVLWQRSRQRGPLPSMTVTPLPSTSFTPQPWTGPVIPSLTPNVESQIMYENPVTGVWEPVASHDPVSSDFCTRYNAGDFQTLIDPGCGSTRDESLEYGGSPGEQERLRLIVAPWQ